MAQITVIAPTEDAVTNYPQVNAQAYSEVVFTTDAMNASNECDIYKAVGGGWEVASDATGTAYKLTATIQMLRLVGGCIYAVNKDATAGSAAGVWADLVP